MISFLAPIPGTAAPWAMLAQVAVADTVVTIQATSTGWAFWVDMVTSVATIVIALALILGGIAAIPLGLNALRALRTVNQLAAQVRGDVAPLIKHGHAAVENLDQISGAVRVQVQRLTETVQGAQERLDRAATLAENRLNDFDALLRVVQEEAEELFIDTASTVHGARVGAETFRGFGHADEPPPEEHRDA